MSEFRTRNLYEAAYLMIEGQELLGLEGEPKHYIFVFKGEKCKKLSKDFWDRKAIGNIAEFTDTVRKLKDRVFIEAT